MQSRVKHPNIVQMLGFVITNVDPNASEIGILHYVVDPIFLFFEGLLSHLDKKQFFMRRLSRVDLNEAYPLIFSMVCEFVPGGDLFHWLESNEAISFRTRLRVAVDIARYSSPLGVLLASSE